MDPLHQKKQNILCFQIIFDFCICTPSDEHFLKKKLIMIQVLLKAKVYYTLATTVLVFIFFIFFYPQGKYLTLF
jgi:hypothetical protein